MPWLDLSMAFSVGIIGSIHCVGMCGGIVAALTMGRPSVWLAGITLYHAGRIVSYSLIGLLLGFLGHMFTDMSGISLARRFLSITAGILMIFFALQVGGFIPEKLFQSIFSIPSGLLRKTAQGKALFFWAIAGAANGLLPCGMVYAAGSLALKEANLIHSMLIMAAFGLGTVPAMTGLAVIIRKWAPLTKGRFIRITAVILLLFGLFTITRGFIPLDAHNHGEGRSHEENIALEKEKKMKNHRH
ncbi:MAG: sulfite exporter TauE/SafE family protein [Deltaproteobacteria bacterium]|nr:sulfite exporter TauE/SafE family protein [Deltaproteobacteria bacterium]